MNLRKRNLWIKWASPYSLGSGRLKVNKVLPEYLQISPEKTLQ